VQHQLLELLTGVLAAAIGVMQQRVGLASSPDCHHQRIGDELGRHRSAHRPAHYTPGAAAGRADYSSERTEQVFASRCGIQQYSDFDLEKALKEHGIRTVITVERSSFRRGLPPPASGG
jgi:hypothetical protein